MLCLLSTASCARPIVSSSPGTVQCLNDCVTVTKGILKEHAQLFDETIRLRDALSICEKRK